MAAELEAEPRTVLVHFKQHARPVSFLVAEPNKYAKTHALVKAAITTTFRSLLQDQTHSDFSLQVKDDDWGGVFVDLLESPNRNILEGTQVRLLHAMCVQLRIKLLIITF